MTKNLLVLVKKRFLESVIKQDKEVQKMLSQDFIFCKTKELLDEFISPIAACADKPRKKFLRQVLSAILFSGSLVVTDMTRWIHDDCTDIFHRLKRLLNHLISPVVNLTSLVEAYRHNLAGYVEPDTPIIIDLTDVAKPRARKMKYAALVRDGSEHKLVTGYWCVEVYAHLRKKRILPLALDVFSIQDPAIGSQNLQIDKTISSVNRALGGKGIWIADRGFDGLNIYETWFSHNCHFVVRQRGDRYVTLPDGIRALENDLIEHMRQSNAQAGLQTDIVFGKVYLPDNNRPVYIVASWLPGADEPLILLTTLVVENLQQARGIIWYYKQRWACEETSRFLKSRVGFECFRIRRYEAIQRLAILAMFAMGFLTWILLRSCRTTYRLFAFTSRFRKDTRFVYYRLLDGLQEFGRLYRLKLSQIFLEFPRNG
jgi:hypothetical protein